MRKALRFEEAITAHQEAITIYRETGDRHREGLALSNLELDQAEQNRETDEKSDNYSSSPNNGEG
jgi:hypothetical protein